jgi:NAD+ kinase
VCIGGDGTVLRAAQLTIPHPIPILGVNMGRLGFLTDLSPRDCFNNVERILDEDWRLEERLMVRGDILDGPGDEPNVFHGLNDIVISRRAPGRPIYVEVRIDHLVMTPVSAHLAMGRSIVLQPESVVEMEVSSEHGAIVSVDGQEDLPVNSGVRLTVRASEHRTRFVRFREPSSFYADLAEKLEFQMSSTMNSRA